MLVMLLGLVSLSTDAFGVLPPSELSKNFRETLGEVLPAGLIEPINNYLAQIPSSPQIPFGMGDEMIDQPTEQDLNELAEQIAEEMAAVIVAEQGLDTATEETQDPAAEETTGPTTEETTDPPAPPPPVVYVPPPPPPPSTPTNKAPSCVAKNYTSPQTTSVLPMDISAICSDPDGDTWSITAVTQGTNGAASISGKTINYNPNDGFAGTDSLTFTIADTKGATYSQSANITINNSPPVANNDSVYAAQNSVNNTYTPLSNDTDLGGDTLNISGMDASGITGTATITPDGQSIIYTPTSGSPPSFGHTGFDYIYYTVEDSHGGIAIGELEILVGVPAWCGKDVGDAYLGCQSSAVRLNGVPQDTLTVAAGSTFTFQFDFKLWTDNPGAIRQVIPGFNGSPATSCAFDSSGGPTSYAAATVTTSPLYTFTAPATTGTYTIHAPVDWQFNCADAQANYTDRGEVLATITVVPNSSPTCLNFNHSAQENSPQQTVNIQSWCSDPDGDPFTIISASNSLGLVAGTISYDTDNIYFTPETGFVGTDVITFTIDDGASPPYTHSFDLVIYQAIVMYSAGDYEGDFGDRSSTNTLCQAANPTLYPNVRAFIGYNSTDSIANMPTVHNVPTDKPVESILQIRIADNWADLLDGAIAYSLSSANITQTHWWSGVEASNGTFIDGTSPNCNDWTSNSTAVAGQHGSIWATDSTWIANYPAACGGQTLALLCIAYP